MSALKHLHQRLRDRNNTFLGILPDTPTPPDTKTPSSAAGPDTTNTTGYDNTFLGFAAGYSNTTGYDNTFLGLRPDTPTPPEPNIFIGRMRTLNSTEPTHAGSYPQHTPVPTPSSAYSAGYYNTTGV